MIDRKKAADKAEDYRFGVIASTLCNLQRNPKKQKKAFEPSDFFLSLKDKDAADKKQTWKQHLAIATQLHALFKGVGKPKPQEDTTPQVVEAPKQKRSRK